MIQAMAEDCQEHQTPVPEEVEVMEHHHKKETLPSKSALEEVFQEWNHFDWSRPWRRASCWENGVMKRRCGTI